EGGEVISVRTAAPSSRLVTTSSLHKKGTQLLATSMVRTLDVLSNVVQEIETGEGTGPDQTRLSRTSTFERNGSGFVKGVLGPDGAATEYDLDFLGQPAVMRQLRTVGVGDVDITKFTYDRRGALRTLTDPSVPPQVTTQDYSGFGEPKLRTSPGTPTVVSQWTYDVVGRVDTERTGSSTLRYVYEA